jgi:hypothetical protein
MNYGHGNLLRHTRWYFLVILVKWKLVSVHWEIGAQFVLNVP